jgi:proton-translocating NADH-quinone oxidoreductase chain M
MSVVLTFLGLVSILILALALGGYFRNVDQVYFSRWPLYETLEYVGVFLSVLTVYPFFIMLYLTVEYQRSIRDIIGYYYDSFILWADIQFVPLCTMVALTVNMVYLMIPEHRIIGKRKHTIISRTIRLTSLLFSVYLYSLVFSLIDSSELGVSAIYNLGSLILFGLCILLSHRIAYKPRLYFVLLHLIIISLIGAFSTYNLLYFYFFFEMTMIPVFLIIIIWGSREEKSVAAYQLFLYTLLGSLLFLMGLIFIAYTTGSTFMKDLQAQQLTYDVERMLFAVFFLGFAIKIPMFPTHIWLPKAHVEAPTVGSILLAGILLKLGSYVYIRFLPLLFPSAFVEFRPYVTVLALLGIIYASFTILRQTDLKRIVAYSSISHMNLVTIGALAGNLHTVAGAILLTIAHGLASGGLFACVGSIYDRLKTRNILYLRALSSLMPILSAYFFLFTLANIGFPPSLNFISEMIILFTIAEENTVLLFLLIIGVTLSAISGFFTFTRVFFGNYDITLYGNHIRIFSDITSYEFLSLLPLLILCYGLGLYPVGLISVIT